MDRKALEEVDETTSKKLSSTLKHATNVNPLVESLENDIHSENIVSNDQNIKKIDKLHKENIKMKRYEEPENDIYSEKTISCSIRNPESCEMCSA